MSENNQMMSVEGQLIGLPLAGPESFSQQQLDYLKRALGVDETVLFEDSTGTGANSGTISEAYTNFERLRIEVGLGNQQSTGNDGYIYVEISPRSTYAYLNYTMGSGGGNQYYATAKLQWTTDTTFSITHGSSILHNTSNNSVSGNTQFDSNVRKCVYRIIGVKRIAGGNT